MQDDSAHVRQNRADWEKGTCWFFVIASQSSTSCVLRLSGIEIFISLRLMYSSS